MHEEFSLKIENSPIYDAGLSPTLSVGEGTKLSLLLPVNKQ